MRHVAAGKDIDDKDLYRGLVFDHLDDKLQDALYAYLSDRLSKDDIWDNSKVATELSQDLALIRVRLLEISHLESVITELLEMSEFPSLAAEQKFSIAIIDEHYFYEYVFYCIYIIHTNHTVFFNTILTYMKIFILTGKP